MNQVIALWQGELPSTLLFPGMRPCRVERYVGKPTFCGNWQKWGHRVWQCDGKTRCGFCAGNHDSKLCREKIDKPKCPNSYQEHCAWSFRFPLRPDSHLHTAKGQMTPAVPSPSEFPPLPQGTHQHTHTHHPAPPHHLSSGTNNHPSLPTTTQPSHVTDQTWNRHQPSPMQAQGATPSASSPLPVLTPSAFPLCLGGLVIMLHSRLTNHPALPHHLPAGTNSHPSLPATTQPSKVNNQPWSRHHPSTMQAQGAPHQASPSHAQTQPVLSPTTPNPDATERSTASQAPTAASDVSATIIREIQALRQEVRALRENNEKKQLYKENQDLKAVCASQQANQDSLRNETQAIKDLLTQIVADTRANTPTHGEEGLTMETAAHVTPHKRDMIEWASYASEQIKTIREEKWLENMSKLNHDASMTQVWRQVNRVRGKHTPSLPASLIQRGRHLS
ncbi:mucin-2-like [Scylla paramamosain]|uniref:mucin-2-like n=1 Tax=Scylla paramamosain TaxID=85552 RepID=UPI003083E2D8